MEFRELLSDRLQQPVWAKSHFEAIMPLHTVPFLLWIAASDSSINHDILNFVGRFERLSPSLQGRIISCALLLVASSQAVCLPAQGQGDESNPAFETGLERMGHRDYDGAVTSFTEVIAFDSKNSKAYVMRGKAFFQLRDYRRAIEDFAREIAQSANDSESFLWKGAAESRLGQDDDAVNDYEKAIRLDMQLVKNYDEGKNTQGGKPTQSAASGSGAHASQNEHSVQNYEAAMRRVKGSP